VNKESKELRVIDGLGCANYKGQLPKGETAQSQAGHKEALQLLFQRDHCDEDEVVQLCSLSYYSQRIDINSMMAAAVLVVEWLFLFKEQYFFNHAQDLLGFDVETRLNNALQNKGTRLITFLVPRLVQAASAYTRSPSQCAVIGLVAHFVFV